MNSKRYPVQNYVPTNPMKRLNSSNFGHDLDSTLKKMAFEKIIDEPDYHFQNCYINNFDLIHHECRGDELSYTKKHYETIFNKKINEEIATDNLRYRFISSAIKSERKDVVFEEEVFNEHFNRNKLEKKLEKKGVFLSSMKKKVYINKKTDDCKSLCFKNLVCCFF